MVLLCFTTLSYSFITPLLSLQLLYKLSIKLSIVIIVWVEDSFQKQWTKGRLSAASKLVSKIHNKYYMYCWLVLNVKLIYINCSCMDKSKSCDLYSQAIVKFIWIKQLPCLKKVLFNCQPSLNIRYLQYNHQIIVNIVSINRA